MCSAVHDIGTIILRSAVHDIRTIILCSAVHDIGQDKIASDPEWPHRQCVGLAFRRSHVRISVSAVSVVICSPH